MRLVWHLILLSGVFVSAHSSALGETFSFAVIADQHIYGRPDHKAKLEEAVDWIIREKDRTKLLQGACDNLIENRGYYNAWIALLHESGRLDANAESGLGKDFLPMVEQLKHGAMTECARRALAQSGVVLIQDPFSDCTDCPLSGKYAGRGAITLRLEHGGKIYGILSVSTPREVVNFYSKVNVAGIRIISRDIKRGENVLVSGKTTPAKIFQVDEIHKDQKAVNRGKKGELVGIKLPFRVRRNDKIFSYELKK